MYPCRLCHDEKENHKLVRADVKFIECLQCGSRQKVVYYSKGLYCNTAISNSTSFSFPEHVIQTWLSGVIGGQRAGLYIICM